MANASLHLPSCEGALAVEALDRIDEAIRLAENARSVPMSSNCILNRQDLLSMLEQLRTELPEELRGARTVLEERDKVIASGHRDVEQLIREGEAEKARRVSIHEVTLAAEQESARILEEARSEAQRQRDETEQYIDTSLANFEQLLQRTLATVEHGRTRMRALPDMAGGFPDQPDDKPLPF